MNRGANFARYSAGGAIGGEPTPWRPQAFADAVRLPLISAADVEPILPDFDLWDCWPLQHEDGRTVTVDGSRYWFFLSAPRLPDPGQRHLCARIRLLRQTGGQWFDCGYALPQGMGLGHAEWAGSAVLHDDGKTVSLYHTASGSASAPGFEQRLVVANATLSDKGITGWTATRELVVADGSVYTKVDAREGEPGRIKAFRDPAWFRDPQTGAEHILFTASYAGTQDDFNGLIGIATLEQGSWHLERPLISAIGVNNELERPHIVMRDGLYYLFWSTQHFVFSPEVEAGPNGLYAMVADRLDGEWRPVNGSGLVAANPDNEPTQSYSWWVTGEGVVWSFIDHWGMAGRSLDDQPDLRRRQFGGTPAPRFSLLFDGDTVSIDAG